MIKVRGGTHLVSHDARSAQPPPKHVYGTFPYQPEILFNIFPKRICSLIDNILSFKSNWPELEVPPSLSFHFAVSHEIAFLIVFSLHLPSVHFISNKPMCNSVQFDLCLILRKCDL